MLLCHSERSDSAALRIPDGRKGQILMSSERSDSAAEESSRRRIYYIFTLRWIPRQARNDEKKLSNRSMQGIPRREHRPTGGLCSLL